MLQRGNDDEGQLLATLQRFMEIPGANVQVSLGQAVNLVAELMAADKVDAFLHDPTRDSLVAVGTSQQPLSELQKKHGLDVMPVANGGRAVDVFRGGRTYASGHVEDDADELKGVREALGIRSEIGVPIAVNGAIRGTLMVASRTPGRFQSNDVRFVESVGRWVSALVYRAELLEEITRNAAAKGRQAVAEELLTTMAHDMRNHIGPIKFRLASLRQRAERDHRTDDCHELDRISRSVSRLGALISNNLDLARIDHGLFQIQTQPLDTASLVQECAEALGTPDRPVEVHVAEPIMVAGDQDRLRQCLENLLANAIKHSPARVPVRIEVSRRRDHQGDRALIAIADKGPGVPPDVLPRIFDRYVSGRGKEGGLGLGLFLAHRIALLHGGELSVRSVSGQGARFTLELPAYNESA
jgi:two-component system OmpR family sensor kinase